MKCLFTLSTTISLAANAFPVDSHRFSGQNKASFVDDHDASILPVTITSAYLLHMKEDIKNIT